VDKGGHHGALTRLAPGGYKWFEEVPPGGGARRKEEEKGRLIMKKKD